MLTKIKNYPDTWEGVKQHALAVTAAAKCPQLQQRQVSPHTLRHTAAMHLLQGRGHSYVEADLTMKEHALAIIGPPETKRTRYRPTDALLKFLESF